MTPPPDDLDREIADALGDVDLQSIGSEEEEQRQQAKAGGERLWTGVVAGVHGDDVIVELGPRMQGVASLREFEEAPEVGSSHQFVVRGREEDLWVLSLTAAKELAAWAELTEGSHVKARVTGQNQGGLELKIGSHGAFMPASQVAIGHEADLSAFIGQTIVCEVLEIDRKRDRVVLSRRKVLEEERAAARSEAVGRLQPGSKLHGKVTRVEPFGAFVDLGGGLEGLVHVSQLAHRRVEDATQEVEVGQQVDVMLLEIKEGGKRIALGIKQLLPDPWADLEERFPGDREVSGTVTRLADFGAFVELEPGLEGLLHVSQLGRERVRRASDVLSVGETVTVRIQSVDPAARRLSLTRLDARGAVLGSEEAVESDVIEKNLAKPGSQPLGTNLGALFKKALENKGGQNG